MRFWNDGNDKVNMVQNQFTKYLVVAIHHKKVQFCWGAVKSVTMRAAPMIGTSSLGFQ